MRLSVFDVNFSTSFKPPKPPRMFFACMASKNQQYGPWVKKVGHPLARRPIGKQNFSDHFSFNNRHTLGNTPLMQITRSKMPLAWTVKKVNKTICLPAIDFGENVT